MKASSLPGSGSGSRAAAKSLHGLPSAPHAAVPPSELAEISVSDRLSGVRSEQAIGPASTRYGVFTGTSATSNLGSAPVTRRRSAAAAAASAASATAAAPASTASTAVAPASTSTVVAPAVSSRALSPAQSQAGQPEDLFQLSAALALPPAALVVESGVALSEGGVAESDGRGCTPSAHRCASIPSFRWCGRSTGLRLSEASQGNSPHNAQWRGRASPILSPFISRGFGRASPMIARELARASSMSRLALNNNSPMPRTSHGTSPSGRLAAPPRGYPPGRQVTPGVLHPPCGSPLGRQATPGGLHPPCGSPLSPLGHQTAPGGLHQSCGSPLWRQQAPPLPEPLLLPSTELQQVPACGGSADQGVDRPLAQRLKALVQWALQPSQPSSPKGPRRMTAAEALSGYPLACELSGHDQPHGRLGHDRPLSPRSVASESTLHSANTGTTATDCRGALASLRMLAQHLPPASHHRSPSDPTAAAVALAVNLRTIGVREPPGGSSPPTATARRPPPLQPHVGVAQLQADDASFGFDQACPAATTGGADLHTQLQAAAAAQLQLCTHPATEVRSRPPRGAAAATAADQAAELEAAYAAGIQAAVLALPQAAAAPRSVVKPLRTPIGPQSGCSLLSGAGPSTGRPGLPPEGWRAPRLTLPATSLGPHVPTSQLPSPRHSPRNRASNKQPAPLSAAGTEAMKRVQRTRSITPLGTRLPTVPQSPNIKATVPTQPVPDGCTRGSSSSVPESLQSDDGIMMV